MAIGRPRWAPFIGVVAALFLIAGVTAAAGAGFSASNSLGAGQRVITSPCSSVVATIVPAYDTDGFYKVAAVETAMTCAAGEYSLRITLATGASTYVERSTTVLFATQGSQTATVLFPTAVKVADVTNIAALVLPTGN